MAEQTKKTKKKTPSLEPRGCTMLPGAAPRYFLAMLDFAGSGELGLAELVALKEHCALFGVDLRPKDRFEVRPPGVAAVHRRSGLILGVWDDQKRLAQALLAPFVSHLQAGPSRSRTSPGPWLMSCARLRHAPGKADDLHVCNSRRIVP